MKNSTKKEGLSHMKPMTKRTSEALSSELLSLSNYKANNHLINVLEKMQCGQFTCRNLQTYMIQRSCVRVQPDAEFVNSSCINPRLKLEEITEIEVSPERDKIICVSSLESSFAQCIQLISVTEEKCSNDKDKKNMIVLHIKPPDLSVDAMYSKISSLRLAPIKNLPGCNTVLYAAKYPTAQYSSCYSSTVHLSNLDAPTSSGRNLFRFDVGEKNVWTMAWNTHNGQFIISLDCKCKLIDVTTQKQWTFSTHDSDSLAQVFSSVNPHVMYNGTRKGEILIHDIRNRNSFHPQVVLSQNAGISCLRLLQDENYVLASDFSGAINTWDQRSQKIVTKFASHLSNSQYQLPFHLDETESVICGTGCDSYTSFWDVKSGNLLRTIPAPYPVSSWTSIPVSFYSNRWANIDGNCALLIGMENKFKVYCHP